MKIQIALFFDVEEHEVAIYTQTGYRTTPVLTTVNSFEELKIVLREVLREVLKEMKEAGL